MNTVQAVAKILRSEGVKWVSCFPSNPLIEEVAKEGVRPVMFRHERGAVMAADGFSRVNSRDKFGVVITQSGPGAENSMGGIAQAFSDNVPVLYLPAGPQLNQYAIRPNFSAVRTFQTTSTYGEVITHPDQVSNVMRRAFHHLRNGQPGPVIVEIPADVGNQELLEDTIDYRSPRRARQVPDPDDVNMAVELLLKAKKPVIWAGMGVLLSGASEVLQMLAELTGIPIYCTMPGKSAFDERHSLSLGAGSGATTLPARRWIQESDVLFAVGSSLTRTPYGQPIPDGKIIIHNTENREDINKDYPVEIGLPGDAQLTLQSMVELVKSKKQPPADVTQGISNLKEEWIKDWTPLLNSDEIPLNIYRVIGDIIKTLDLENSIVTHDAGGPRDSILPFYPATVPHSYVGWGKTTHLGFGIPLMIGAKLANPDKFCLNFMGDGAFGMPGLDIETAVREKAPITTIVLNNGGMATYPGGMPVARERYGTTEMTGDYAKIAEGMGAVGIVVIQPTEMVPALRRAQQLNAEAQTVLIDVHSNMEARRSRP